MSKQLEVAGTAIMFLLLAGLVVGVGYTGWRIQRWYHYKFGYASQVSDTVRELVKPECLK